MSLFQGSDEGGAELHRGGHSTICRQRMHWGSAQASELPLPPPTSPASSESFSLYFSLKEKNKFYNGEVYNL